MRRLALAVPGLAILAIASWMLLIGQVVAQKPGSIELFNGQNLNGWYS